MSNEDIPVKGLDSFAKQFLLGGNDANDSPEETEYIRTQKGQKASSEAMKQYEAKRIQDFVKRAAGFTEDLLGFIVEQKQAQGLSDTELVFAVALATINLRNSYASAQNKDEEEKLTQEKQDELLKEFDRICWGAQQYWNNNQ